MMQFDQWQLPDGEVHLMDWMIRMNRRIDGRLTYQYHKYEAALRYMSSRRIAVDIGAHVGLWSYWMARDFERVVAFEPMDEHADCWGVNMQARKNAVLHRVALGERCGPVMLRTRTPGSSGDTGVEPMMNDNEGGQVAEQRRLDDYDLQSVDFIKVDVEGYEHLALAGAPETIRRCRPVIIVEQKGYDQKIFGWKRNAAIKYLSDMGMTALCDPVSDDWIMGWK